MTNDKYVGLDVHQASTSIAVIDGDGKSVVEGVVRTRADAIRDFINSLSGNVRVTLEEGTQAAWLYEIVKPLVVEVVVCDPRQNKVLAVGNKGDRVDANKLAQLLRSGLVKHVYHNNRDTKSLKQLAHNYGSILGDCTRVMNRIKALYRGQGIPCSGRDIYYRRNRSQWLARLTEPSLRIRAQFLFDELDALKDLRRAAKNVLLREARRHQGFKVLSKIPTLGPIRSAQIIAAVGSPHRFRTRRQFWAYCGLAVVTRSTDDYRFSENGALRRTRPPATRGLNRNFNRKLKHVFKSAALDGIKRDPFKSFYQSRVVAGIRPEMARLTLARKIANLTLTLWKNGDQFDEHRMKEHSTYNARS
jgi:transposase